MEELYYVRFKTKLENVIYKAKHQVLKHAYIYASELMKNKDLVYLEVICGGDTLTLFRRFK